MRPRAWRRPLNVTRNIASLALLCCGLVIAVEGCDSTPWYTVERHARSEAFRAFHEDVRQLPFRNVAVLPEGQRIVIDGIVVDLKNRTWGEEPAGASYGDYYRSSSENHFESLAVLLEQRQVQVSEGAVLQIVREMRRRGVGDILREPEKNRVVYSWDMSAMWGAKGLMAAIEGNLAPDASGEFDLTRDLGNGFVYWEVS